MYAERPGAGDIPMDPLHDASAVTPRPQRPEARWRPPGDLSAGERAQPVTREGPPGWPGSRAPVPGSAEVAVSASVSPGAGTAGRAAAGVVVGAAPLRSPARFPQPRRGPALHPAPSCGAELGRRARERRELEVRTPRGERPL